MPSPGNYTASWLLLFSWYMVSVTTNVLGFLFYHYVTFIMTRMRVWHAHTTRPTRWTALPLVDPPHQMHFWSTIHGQRNITSQTPTALIPTNCLPWFIHDSLTTAVSSACCTGMTILSLRRNTHRAHTLNATILPQICFWQAQSWISLFTPTLMVWQCT
jgi:hypothetical protein